MVSTFISLANHNPPRLSKKELPSLHEEGHLVIPYRWNDFNTLFCHVANYRRTRMPFQLSECHLLPTNLMVGPLAIQELTRGKEFKLIHKSQDLDAGSTVFPLQLIFPPSKEKGCPLDKPLGAHINFSSKFSICCQINDGGLYWMELPRI